MNLIKTNKLPSVKTDRGRYYWIEEAETWAPSITTILKYRSAKRIAQWRKRVGDAEANRVSRAATARGTSFHILSERYIKKEPVDIKAANLLAQELWPDAVKVLDRVTNPFMIEQTLYHPILKVAGRLDIGAEFDNVLSIIDTKTANRHKPRHHCEDYFTQVCFYALCCKYVHKIDIQQLTLLIFSPDGPQVYTDPISVWTGHLKDAILNYTRNVPYPLELVGNGPKQVELEKDHDA